MAAQALLTPGQGDCNLHSGMAKGSGRVGRSSAGSGGSRANPQLADLMSKGFSGAVPQQGMRAASLEHLRAGGAVHGGSPILKIRADGGVQIVDGRHRITLAREAGAKSIRARVIVEGPRGGSKQYAERDIPLRPASPGEQQVRRR